MSQISKSLTQGFGDGSELWAFLNELVDDVVALEALVNDLKAKYDALVTNYNEHTHVENADAAYTQSASVAAVITASQGTATEVAAVTLKTSK